MGRLHSDDGRDLAVISRHIGSCQRVVVMTKKSWGLPPEQGSPFVKIDGIPHRFGPVAVHSDEVIVVYALVRVIVLGDPAGLL